MILSRRFQAQMLLGELLLLLIAALDAALRTTRVLRLSVDRPRRPSAEQFAKQQRHQQLKSGVANAPSSKISSAPASAATTTTTRTTAAAGAAATAAAKANGSSTATAAPPPPPPPPAAVERHLDAVIIGGGAAGVSAAAALSRAGLASVAVLERHAAPGDVWRRRYASLTLHDIADDCALPFVRIPDSLPVYLPAGVFADYLDFHARIHRVDFRGGVEATGVEPLFSVTSSSSSPSGAAAAAGGGGADALSSVSPSGDRWRVRARPVSGEGGSGGGAGGADSASSPPSSPLCFEAQNVIFADGGLYNAPKIPDFARRALDARASGDDQQSAFQGEVLHSSQISAREGSCSRFAGKRVLVVGFGNSAMDVVQELVAVGARAVIVAVRDPSRRAVVPLLAYGAYQEQLARYPWLLWADRAATFLEARSVASSGVLKGVESGGGGFGGCGDDDDDIDGNGNSSFNAAFSPLFLLLAAVASALAPLFRSLANGIDVLLDSATAARSLRAWAALGARGGDLSPYGLSTLPGGKGDCGPVTWTKRTANVLVMDTGAVKEVIRGNARVVVAAVERLGPGKRVELRPTGAVAAVGNKNAAAAFNANANAANAASLPSSSSPKEQEEEDEDPEPRLPSSASPATAALLASVGGEIPGGEAPVLAPAPRHLDDIDAVILCTGFDTMQQCYGLISDEKVREKLGGGGASGYLVPPEQRGSGAIECGRPVPGLPGVYFVYGRLTQVRDGALEVARRIAAEGRWRKGGRRAGGGAGGGSKQE